MSVAEVHWVTRLVDKGVWAPFWLGLSIAIGYLLIRCAFDGFFLATWGFPQGFDPLWRSAQWWTELVNATLLGYVPAVLVIAHRGIDRDLSQLRRWLPQNDAEVADIRAAAIHPTGLAGRAFKLSGLVGGFVLVFVDPSLSLGAERSPTNPAFMWPLLRIPVMAWLFFTLIASDLNATRTYLRVGRNLIEVDLLDVQSLSPFARRGLRSALTWVLFSVIFSLFWLGEDTASRQNPLLLAVVLAMATAAFVVPLVGVHTNIRSVKRLELDRLRDEIRIERAAVTNKLSDENVSPRLANLIAYYQLIDQVREWPIDAVNLLKFFMYLLIGLGSWLGGAVVERLLDRTLGT
ncbi:MAG: hypothetical protein O7C67_12885 [Gammaproteobacteria bacterium]|nr:hypothetical protein [Gammaproteobacteria bacterium]